MLNRINRRLIRSSMRLRLGTTYLWQQEVNTRMSFSTARDSQEEKYLERIRPSITANNFEEFLDVIKDIVVKSSNSGSAVVSDRFANEILPFLKNVCDTSSTATISNIIWSLPKIGFVSTIPKHRELCIHYMNGLLKRDDLSVLNIFSALDSLKELNIFWKDIDDSSKDLFLRAFEMLVSTLDTKYVFYGFQMLDRFQIPWNDLPPYLAEKSLRSVVIICPNLPYIKKDLKQLMIYFKNIGLDVLNLDMNLKRKVLFRLRNKVRLFSHLESCGLIYGLSRIGFRWKDLPEGLQRRFGNHFLNMNDVREPDVFFLALDGLARIESDIPSKMLLGFVERQWIQIYSNCGGQAVLRLLAEMTNLHLNWSETSTTMKHSIMSLLHRDRSILTTHEITNLFYLLGKLRISWQDMPLSLTREFFTHVLDHYQSLTYQDYYFLCSSLSRMQGESECMDLIFNLCRMSMLPDFLEFEKDKKHQAVLLGAQTLSHFDVSLLSVGPNSLREKWLESIENISEEWTSDHTNGLIYMLAEGGIYWKEMSEGLRQRLMSDVVNKHEQLSFFDFTNICFGLLKMDCDEISQDFIDILETSLSRLQGEIEPYQINNIAGIFSKCKRESMPLNLSSGLKEFLNVLSRCRFDFRGKQALSFLTFMEDCELKWMDLPVACRDSIASSIVSSQGSLDDKEFSLICRSLMKMEIATSDIPLGLFLSFFESGWENLATKLNRIGKSLTLGALESLSFRYKDISDKFRASLSEQMASTYSNLPLLETLESLVLFAKLDMKWSDLPLIYQRRILSFVQDPKVILSESEFGHLYYGLGRLVDIEKELPIDELFKISDRWFSVFNQNPRLSDSVFNFLFLWTRLAYGKEKFPREFSKSFLDLVNKVIPEITEAKHVGIIVGCLGQNNFVLHDLSLSNRSFLLDRVLHHWDQLDRFMIANVCYGLGNLRVEGDLDRKKFTAVYQASIEKFGSCFTGRQMVNVLSGLRRCGESWNQLSIKARNILLSNICTGLVDCSASERASMLYFMGELGMEWNELGEDGQGYVIGALVSMNLEDLQAKDFANICYGLGRLKANISLDLIDSFLANGVKLFSQHLSDRQHLNVALVLGRKDYQFNAVSSPLKDYLLSLISQRLDHLGPKESIALLLSVAKMGAKWSDFSPHIESKIVAVLNGWKDSQIAPRDLVSLSNALKMLDGRSRSIPQNLRRWMTSNNSSTHHRSTSSSTNNASPTSSQKKTYGSSWNAKSDSRKNQ